MKETDFARYLTQFLSTYLPGQVGSKRNTQLAYRDSFSLFLRYCRDQENLSPEKLTIAKVDRELILRFLQWLEDERNCKAATRNQRLAAIHSFFSFLMVEEPQYMQQSQKILAIPMKKTDKPPLMYLPLDSIRGLLEQPDRTTIQGKRDAVLLSLLYDTGARVQELVDLKVCDIALNDTVTIILTGKGGKSRIVPVMKPTGELLKQYMEGSGLTSPVYGHNPLFTNRGNKPLTRAGFCFFRQSDKRPVGHLINLCSLCVIYKSAFLSFQIFFQVRCFSFFHGFLLVSRNLFGRYVKGYVFCISSK